MKCCRHTFDLRSEIFAEYRKVLIFGNGGVGEVVYRDIVSCGVNDFCFVVSNESHRMRRYSHGVRVYTLSELPESYLDGIFIVAVTGRWRDELVAKCEELHVRYLTVSDSYVSTNSVGIEERLNEIEMDLQRVKRKLSMPDFIWQMGKVKFFVPRYPLDFLQRHVVDTGTFFEQDILEDLRQYIPNKAIILDVGSNVGNHAVYWGLFCNPESIWAFEPVPETFDILQKNIELNHLEDRVKSFNIGLSDCSERASYLTYRMENCGDTHLAPQENGNMNLVPADEFLEKLQRIDFVKIDVEDYEAKVLMGARKILTRHKPTIFIESLPHCFQRTNLVLEEMGYILRKKYPHHNFLYQYK